MNFADTHTHLYEPDYSEDFDGAVERAVAAGVTLLVFPDVCSKSRQAMFDLAARHPGTVFPSIGLHPTEVGENWKDEMSLLYANSGRQDIVAVGETGMDLHWSREFIKEQEEVFRLQLNLSIEKGLPVIIHNREATEITLKILSDYRGKGLRGVFHAYGGSIETFREAQKYGDFYAGIGGVVTFKKASIAETVREIPLDRILTETDAPWLAPAPHRGTRNESAYIPIIAEKIAVQKGLPVETVAEAAWNNAIKLFGI